MYFYEQKIPERNTIVVADMSSDKKTEGCIYVTLPEYKNLTGIIYRKELPNRFKDQKRVMADMKKAVQIVCVVTNPITDTQQVELSIKGVDTKYHEAICIRYKTIEKILKIMKFISIKFNIDYYDLVQNLQETVIKPLTEIDETKGIDCFEILYASCLRDIRSLLKLVPLVDDVREQVIDTLQPLVRETNATSSLMFDVFVWKGDRDNSRTAVILLQSFFRDIKAKFLDRTVDIRYIGAPRYQIDVKSIAINDIDDLYSEIKTSMIEWMTTNNVTCYDLQFDLTQKQVTPGDVSITFPFHIEMVD